MGTDVTIEPVASVKEHYKIARVDGSKVSIVCDSEENQYDVTYPVVEVAEDSKVSFLLVGKQSTSIRAKGPAGSVSDRRWRVSERE